MGIVHDQQITTLPEQSPIPWQASQKDAQTSCGNARQWSEVTAAGRKRQKTSTEERTAERGKYLLIQSRNIILIVSMPLYLQMRSLTLPWCLSTLLELEEHSS